MATYDYTAMKERSGVPEVKDLYHSSGTNFPDPIAANPQMRERFNRDAGKSLETQVKMITSVVSAPTAGSGIMANAALGGVVGALNAQGDSAWDVAKGAAVGAAVGGAVASAAPVFNQVKNWAGYGPKLVVGIGENGARNLGSTASKLPPAQVLPGETSGIHIMQAPLTTRGRVLTGQGTALDRAIIKVKDHSIVKAASEDIKGLTMSPDQRFGDLIGGSEGRMFKQAYPLGSKTPVVQLDPAKADKSIIDFSKAAGHYEHGTVGGGGEQIVVASPGSRVGDTASILAHEGKHMIEPREPLIQASVHSPNRTSVKPTVVDPETGAISKVSMKRPTMEQPNATANFVEEVTGRSPTLEKGAMFSERQVLANPEYYANGGEHGARIFGAMQEKGTADASEILGSVRTRAKYKLTKDPANISGQRNTTAAVPPDQMAAKAGQAGQADLTGMSNFLATDKVPDTIFGIPIVSRREDYTKADIAFFREHPEAGGYYDMGEGTPEDGTVEGAPVQMDVPKSQLPSATFITGGRDEFDTVEMVQQALKNNYSAEQFLRMYYGDATDRIVGRAKELRGMTAQDMSTVFDLRDYQAVDRGSADPEARSLPRYASGGPRGSIVLPDLPIIAVGPGAVQTNEITKEVMTNIERAAHAELPPLATYENVFEQNRAIRKHSRDAAVLATQKELYRDMEKWLKEEGNRSFEAGRYVYLGSKEDGPHEVSHLLNPNEDLRYAVQYGPTYYLQNDAELAAAISAARREIFKRSGGKIDIADPRHMRAVLNEVKPGATDEETKAKRAPYEGRWLSTEARKFLYNYWTFKGSSRAADVNRKVVDPEFTGKLVSAKRPRKDRV